MTFTRFPSRYRVLLLVTLAAGVFIWGGTRSSLGPKEAVGQTPQNCFQGVGQTPFVQGVYAAPSPAYYVKAYPRSDGSATVMVANGGREVAFYTGYVMALEADYVPGSRSTLVVATVSDQRCGTPEILHVHAAQLDDGAVQFTHPTDYRSPHRTGAYHREICPNGAAQTIVVLEGNNPIIPTDAPYFPTPAPDIPDFSAQMQCPTLSWTRSGGFVGSGLQGCGGCGGLDGQPCQSPCFLTPGVMHAGQCDLNGATPRCNQAAGQYCQIDRNNGDVATCVSQ